MYELYLTVMTSQKLLISPIISVATEHPAPNTNTRGGEERMTLKNCLRALL